MSNHLSYAALLDFTHGHDNEDAVLDTFGHLAYCADCSARLEGVREVCADFERCWSEFESRAGAPRDIPDSSASILVRVTVDRVRAIARIALEYLLPEGEPGYEVRALPIPLGAGADTPTIQQPQAELRIVSPRLGMATVVADAEHQSISVLLRPPDGMTLEALLRERAPRLVLHSPDHTHTHESPFAWVEGANYLLAEMRELEGVEWIVAVEGDPREA